MTKHFIVIMSLTLALAASSGAAAQTGNSPVISTNGSGVCTVSPSVSPGVAGGEWNITCGDINQGSGLTVISPPTTSTAPLPVETAPAPELAPEPAAEAAPAEAAPVESVAEPKPAARNTEAEAGKLELAVGHGKPAGRKSKAAEWKSKAAAENTKAADGNAKPTDGRT